MSNQLICNIASWFYAKLNDIILLKGNSTDFTEFWKESIKNNPDDVIRVTVSRNLGSGGDKFSTEVLVYEHEYEVVINQAGRA